MSGTPSGGWLLSPRGCFGTNVNDGRTASANRLTGNANRNRQLRRIVAARFDTIRTPGRFVQAAIQSGVRINFSRYTNKAPRALDYLVPRQSDGLPVRAP